MNIGSTHAIGGKIEVETLSVVVAQFQPIAASTMEEVDGNVDQIVAFMDRASRGFPGYDIIVTPECSVQGFHPDTWSDVLVDLDGPEVQRLKDKCSELSVWGVFNPFLRQAEGKAGANTAIIVNDQGEIVHTYVKMNPWIPAEGVYPGSGLSVVDGPKGSRLAVIICADGDYPEVWREAAFQGANIIVRIAHYMAPWDGAWEITNKAGAYFNHCYVVAANTVGLGAAYAYFGKSMILSPDGTIIAEAAMGLPWLIKADVYPQLVDQARRMAVANNFLFSFKHRGASCKDFGGDGETTCGYEAYSDWARDARMPGADQ